MEVWHQVCRSSDLAVATARQFEVAGRPVLLIHDGTKVFASAPQCPHLGLSLEKGEVTAGAIRCRAHGYKMDLATGDCLSERGLKLRIYPVEERDGWLCVALSS